MGLTGKGKGGSAGRLRICRRYMDCFANLDGTCVCLRDTDFGGAPCPFYKLRGTERDSEPVRHEEGLSYKRGSSGSISYIR